jgi:hypothetical protein
MSTPRPTRWWIHRPRCSGETIRGKFRPETQGRCTLSRFGVRTVISGFGRSLLRSAALLGVAGLLIGGPSAQASGVSEGGNSRAVWHTELNYTARSVAVSGRFAYLVTIWLEMGTGASRFEVFDISDSERRSSIWLSSAGNNNACVEVAGDLVYVGGRDNLWVGGAPYLRILDVSDPTAPHLVGTYPTTLEIRDIAVDRTTAYLAGQDGLRILDVSDPTSPTPLGSLATPEPARSVAVSGRHAYVAAGAAGLAVVDISDPSSPTVVGTCTLPGPAWDVAVRGSRAYVAGGAGLQVLDVSRPAEPRLIGSVDTPGDARGVAVSGARAYVADGNLEVINIANSRHPVIVNSIVNVPVMESPCFIRQAAAACVGVGSGRVAVAGPVAHSIICTCPAGLGCDRFTGYLDVAPAQAYEPLPPGSGPEARAVGSSAGDLAGTSGTTTPDTFALRGNEPNPFSRETSIRFDAPRSSWVRIQIYDARGRLVQALVNDTVLPGTHDVWWRGRRASGEAVPSGIYYVTMEAENIRQTMKIMLLR